MAWTNTRTWVFGDVLTEDFANDYFSGNLDELRGGGVAIASQAANEVIVAASATQLGRSSGLTYDGTTFSIGGGALAFANGTSNWINWGTSGLGTPTFTTRAAGTRLILYDALNASLTDYALGIDGATLWLGVPVADHVHAFKFFGGATHVASVTGDGAFQVVNHVASAPQGSMAHQSGHGLQIRPMTGSAYDFAMVNAANSTYVMVLPTGTAMPNFPNSLTATSVGIGIAPAVALDVVTGAAIDYVGRFRNDAGSTPFGLLVRYANADPNGTSNQFLTCMGGGATTRMEVRSNGGIANFSANNVNLSDADVKRIKGPAQSQRSQFRQLQLVEGQYLDSNRTNDDVMVTAQNVEAIYPELVEEFSDGLKGVREHGLMMRAFKVIQELADENDALATRVAALEARSPR
jgi:hypothetical protein